MAVLDKKINADKKRATTKGEDFRSRFLKILMEKKHDAEQALARLMEKQEEYKGFLSADDFIEELDHAEREIWAQKYYSILERKNEELEKIEILLRRIQKDEEFGRCEECGKRIPEERLLIVPEATTCVPCQREFEKLDSRKNAMQRSYLSSNRRKELSWDSGDSSNDDEEIMINPSMERLSIMDLEETDLEENAPAEIEN